MNRTQKCALFNAAASLILIVFAVLLFTEIAFLKTIFCYSHWFLAVLILGLIAGAIIFLRRKQSQAEVVKDERDDQIMSRAVLISFASSWVLLALFNLLSRFIIGLDGSISVWMLSIINFVIFLMAMFIYSAAILIQYGRGAKDGE